MTEQEKLHDSAEYKKMRSQQLYCFEAPELMGSIIRANEICAKLSTMTFNSPEYRKIIEELIPGLPKTSAIVPPFHCDHGHGVVIGEHTFINYDCIMLDGGEIRIGAHCKIVRAASSSRLSILSTMKNACSPWRPVILLR